MCPSMSGCGASPHSSELREETDRDECGPYAYGSWTGRSAEVAGKISQRQAARSTGFIVGTKRRITAERTCQEITVLRPRRRSLRPSLKATGALGIGAKSQLPQCLCSWCPCTPRKTLDWVRRSSSLALICTQQRSLDRWSPVLRLAPLDRLHPRTLDSKSHHSAASPRREQPRAGFRPPGQPRSGGCRGNRAVASRPGSLGRIHG